jgi:glycerol-3-phosphate acyltransferase PlsX
MGGDRAPEIVLKGANIAADRCPELHFLVYGDEALIKPLLVNLRRLHSRVTIKHTDNVITNETKPSQAVRNGKGSSMYEAIRAVREGEAQAVISAGNTGALMALAKTLVGTVAGIRRPAITSLLPTFHGEVLMLDLGANLDCDAEILSQFALMGQVFAKTVFSWKDPSVGLLNVGAEQQKGHEEIKKAASLIKELYPHIDFHGYIEGNDIAKGTVDVVVTDGFTGNIALKTAEGTANLVSEFLRQTFKSSVLARLGYLLARPAFHKLRHRLDPRRYNGAVFLGLKQVVIKSHGGTDAVGFAAAIDVAVEMIKNNCLQQMTEQFSKHDASTPKAAAQ